MFLPVFLQNFLFSVERIKISGIAKRTNVFSTLFHKDIEQKSSRRYERDERKWIALVLSVSVLAGTEAVPAFASEMQQEISEMPAVETLQDHTLAETDSVEENCVLVGLKGSYLASADAALKRINEIRKRGVQTGRSGSA